MINVCQVVFTITFTFIFTSDREPKKTNAKSNPGNSSTTAWKPLSATEIYRHSSKNSPGIYGKLTSNSHLAHYLAVSRSFSHWIASHKNLCEEQSGKFFYHCLETIKGYGNVQTFIKKFAGNLLKINVKLAPSPLFGRFPSFSHSIGSQKKLMRRAIREILLLLLGNR